MTAVTLPHQALSAPVARIAALMEGYSIEATRPTDADIAALAAFKSGTRIYLSSVPNRPADEAVHAAVSLRAAGLEPVPHVAARNFSSADALDDFLARLNGEARVDNVLVIAGDRDESGPFRDALSVIASGVLSRRGIRGIGISGYPDGHPRIGDEELDRAMRDKIAAAKAIGLTVEIVTQFCFESRAILDFVARLRASGLHHRLRIGVAGPTSFTSLLRYASRCGVRASAQAVSRRTGLMRQMFAMATPDDILRTLAGGAAADVVPHFFSFGGIPATGRWAYAVAQGRISIEDDEGFRVEPAADGK
jgi:methylenetetrahydrofolate reductase (NADPH)